MKITNNKGIQFEAIATASNNNLLITLINETSSNTYTIPVKKASGFSWKLNKKSVSCDSGNAADIVKLFNNYDAYFGATINNLIFSGNVKQA